MKARIASKKGSPMRAAIGVKTVAIDHHTTPKPNTSFPPILSAHMPPTIYNKGKLEKRTINDLEVAKLSFLAFILRIRTNGRKK